MYKPFHVGRENHPYSDDGSLETTHNHKICAFRHVESYYHFMKSNKNSTWMYIRIYFVQSIIFI